MGEDAWGMRHCTVFLLYCNSSVCQQGRSHPSTPSTHAACVALLQHHVQVGDLVHVLLLSGRRLLGGHSGLQGSISAGAHASLGLRDLGAGGTLGGALLGLRAKAITR